MVTEYFFANLQHLLDSNGLSQLSFAKKINIPQSTVNKWFNRNSVPSPDKIDLLSSFFQVEPHYFFMKPGTQSEPKPIDTKGSLDSFIDEIACKILNTRDLELYKQAGGPSAYLDRMRTNYETDRLSLEDWYVSINEFLKPYVALDIREKVQRKLERSKPQIKKNESA